MLTIINEKTDPRYNLALEEYVLKYLPVTEDFILLWQNESSIIIGRNQNTIEEINTSYVNEHNIHVVRRISGGGAVYHDFGNLNFTFVTNNLKDNLNNYQKFTLPVIQALNELGVKAEFRGRNDIVVDEKKISGNAQSYYKNRMFHHGTILFDANLDMVAKVLQVSEDKIQSKGIKSNRSRVTNILPYLTEKISIKEFKEHLLKSLLKTDDIDRVTYHLSLDDYNNIDKLMKSKYMTWEWNYGESPRYAIQKSRRYEGGKIAFHLDVKDGVIESCKIFGDFLGKYDVKYIEELFKGQLYKEEDIRKILDPSTIEEYFYKTTVDNIINCLFY